MRGEVLTYDDGPGTGLISGDDGARYGFSRSDLQQLTPLRVGTKVDFVPVDGVATQVFVVAPGPGQPASAPYGTAYTPGVAGSGAQFDWRKLFLDANGRIGQKDYWIGFAIVFVVSFILGMLPLIGILFSLAGIYAGVCVASKRLHDMNRTGWLAAIPYGVYAAAVVLSAISVMGMIGAANNDYGPGVAASIGSMGLLWTIAFLANLGFVIWLGVTRGDPGDNRYGPPPAPLANF